MDQGFFIHGTTQMTDQSTDKMFEKIARVEQSLCKLKAETSDLQRMKNKCQIYLQMYQNDYESLKSLYKNLKDKINASERAKDMAPQYSEASQQQQQQQQQQQIQQGSSAAITTSGGSSSSRQNAENQMSDKRSLSSNESIPISTSTSGNALAHIDLPWDIASNDSYYTKSTVNLRYALNTCSVLCSVQFDSTGNRFAFADGRNVFLINTTDGSLLASFDIPHTLSQTEIHTRALTFSPDDRYILISATNNSIIIFSIQSRTVQGTLKEHQGLVSSLLFLPDGHLLSGGFDGVICLWDISTMTLLKKIQHGSVDESKRAKDDMIISLAFAYDQSFIAVGFMNGSVGIYEPTFTQPMNTFVAHSKYMLDVATANKSLMISTSSHDNTVKLWSLRGAASCRQILNGHTNCVLSSCFSNDDSIIFSGSKDETIKAWETKSGTLLFTLTAHKNTLFEVDHHPRENIFVTCSGDGIVCLWSYAPKK